MTTRYGKINFPLQLSSTSSYGDQLLPDDIASTDFTTTKPYRYEPGIVVPAYNSASPDVYVPLHFNGWEEVKAAEVYITNNGPVLIYVAYIPAAILSGAPYYDGTPVTITVAPGRSAMFQATISTAAGLASLGNVFGTATEGQIAIEAEGLPTTGGATVDVLVIPDDGTDVVIS